MPLIEELLEDLRTVDHFFQSHGYHPWRGMDSEQEGLRLELQAGWNALEGLRRRHDPSMEYRNILSYGEKSGPEQGGKRFFVDVRLWGIVSCFESSYNLLIRPFPTSSGSEIEVVERYFSMPLICRAENPLGKMLAVLEEREGLKLARRE